MNKDIKDIVLSLRIKEKREELQKNRDRIIHLRYLMSQLTFNRTVGLYAFTVDEIDYLIADSKKCDEVKRKEIYSKIKELESKALKLQEDPEVQKYAELRDEYYRVLFDNEYFLTVNIGLREELSKIGIPNIYIKQHDYDHDKNIVDKSPLIDEFTKEDLVVIYPYYKMESFRDFRHFYSKTSFKYLEELSKDYSFDVEGKRIGKVRTLSFKKQG